MKVAKFTSFTQREIQLEINSDIKPILSINKSIHYTSTYENTEVTFKSVKKRKILYIYI